MTSEQKSYPQVWEMPNLLWVVVVAVAIMLAAIFYDALTLMVNKWSVSEEYGYGYLIPVIAIFFIWQKKDLIERTGFSGSWVGALIVLTGLCLFVLGELSTLYIIIQYAFLIVLAGLVLALVGREAMRYYWVPLVFLVFMIPLPQFLYNGLSGQLQLISSEIGVAIIRLFGVSVFLEGNVIDLGTYKLQVVEACSGLRYLFPLTSLAFMAAYIFKAAMWKRVIVFLSSMPITVFMNSFRIGVIGVLVDKWGISQAEGFLHYFEGWVIFMACMVILMVEVWVLTMIGSPKNTLSEAFALDFPGDSPEDADVRSRVIPKAFIAAVIMVVASVPISASIGDRQEIYTERKDFLDFPMEINEWTGIGGKLDGIVLDVLKLDDYIVIDFVNDDKEQVNFYVAYYASQSKGESAHSPRSCIPGGGWQIQSLSQKTFDKLIVGGQQLTVNRLEVGKGEYRQLVYYWFQGRSRIITSEYMVKWFLFWDSLTRQRTDGALVRLTAYVFPGEDINEVEVRLEEFIHNMSGLLDAYIPR